LVMLGIAQILIGSSTTLEFLALLLQGSGGGTIVMAIYFLIFMLLKMVMLLEILQVMILM